jgi:hypothetical protein
MKKSLFLAICITISFVFTKSSFSQSVGIGNSAFTPDGSSMLEVRSDASPYKGLLIPRMTQSQRNSISSPATSLLIYQTDNSAGYYFNSGTPSSPSWTQLSTLAGTVTSVGLSMPTEFSVSNSPVTTSGTLTAGWNNQNANYVFAGPASGAAGTPIFRALVASDFPSADSIWTLNSADTSVYLTNSINKVGVGTSTPNAKMVVQGDAINNSSLKDTLFLVKDKDGKAVFAVFPNGVHVYITEPGGAKTNETTQVSGFRVGKKTGTGTKGFGEEYFSISPSNTSDTIDTCSRMIWYPKKEAFASGRILVQSSDSVGTNSWASGYVSKSIGNYSQALGYQSKAIGIYSTAIGRFALAYGDNSFAFGDSVIAGGGSGLKAAANNYCYAFGNNSQAIGNNSYAFGINTLSSGEGSFAFGDSAIATSVNSYSFGKSSKAYGSNSFSLGRNCVSAAEGSLALGGYDTTSAQYTLAVGFGCKASGDFSIAMGYLSKATYVSSTASGYSTFSSGFGATAMGYNTVALGQTSTALGYWTTTNGASATAIGAWSTATGDASLAGGYGCTSKGEFSTSIGRTNISNGSCSFSLGYLNKSNGSYSSAFGINTKTCGEASFSHGEGTVAYPVNSFAIGRYNVVSGDSINWISTDPLFIIGNGSYMANHNAMTVLKNGNVSINGNLDINGSYDCNLDGDNLSYLVNSGKTLLGWNRSGGSGEMSIISNRGAGSTGGFSFIDYSNSNVETVLMTMQGSTGNIGIGTPNPSAQLHSTGNVRFETLSGSGSRFVITDANGNLSAGSSTSSFVSGSGSTGYIPKFSSSSDLTNSIVYESGGYIGIGTTSPGAILNIRGSSGASSQIRLNESSSNNTLVFQSGTGSNMKITGYNYGTSAAIPLYISTDGANTYLQSGGGNVGIGTTTTSNKLEVNGSIRGQSDIYFGTSGAFLAGTNQGGSIELGTENSMSPQATPFIDFHTYGGSSDFDSRIIMTSAGNLKIEGNLYVTGSLSKGSGSFLIDHPTDPYNKTLRHNFVESPENLCMYRGKVKTDKKGKGTVKMPDYFASLTKENEATVILTCIGEHPFLTSYKWNDNYTEFTIFGDPNSEVSYQVMADRDDPAMNYLKKPVEEEKGNGNFNKGELIYPKAYTNLK